MEERKKHILVIDDDCDQLFTTRQILSREGYEVLTHRSPFGVIGLIQASEPDLVLLDANMPSLHGYDLAAFLKVDDRTGDVPVILYSSADESRLRRAVVQHRLRGYICKGDPAELRMKVGYFLREHETDSSSFRKRLYAVD